jgi:antitoxin (DNA-binding transcriptional repressor) of toxin-antitoxin stability system
MLPAKTPRTRSVRTKLTEEEYGRLESLAAKRGITVGERLREDLLEIARLPPSCSLPWRPKPRRTTRSNKHYMIEAMGTLRITEAELARDIHAVLTKVQEGAEVIVEQDHRPVAVIRTPNRSGRPISEILQQAKERNSTVTLDPDFGKDLEAVIASHQQPRNPPSWE